MTFTIPLTFTTGIFIGFLVAVILLFVWCTVLDHVGLGKNL